jgi:hypothetical protein
MVDTIVRVAVSTGKSGPDRTLTLGGGLLAALDREIVWLTG